MIASITNKKPSFQDVFPFDLCFPFDGLKEKKNVRAKQIKEEQIFDLKY